MVLINQIYLSVSTKEETFHAPHVERQKTVPETFWVRISLLVVKSIDVSNHKLLYENLYTGSLEVRSRKLWAAPTVDERLKAEAVEETQHSVVMPSGALSGERYPLGRRLLCWTSLGV